MCAYCHRKGNSWKEVVAWEENHTQCGRVGHDRWCNVGETWWHEGRWKEEESEEK
jgi:hypothetical protein